MPEPVKPSSVEDRRKILRQIFRALVTIAVICAIGYYIFPTTSNQFKTVGDKLAYTLRWQCFSLSTLLFGIIVVANKRFFTRAIDPLKGGADDMLIVESRYLQNTLEQLVVSVTGQLILSTYLTDNLTRVIPILVVLFVIGRVLFWIGYHHGALNRGWGFAMTFHPSVAVHALNIYYFFITGVMFGAH